MNPQEIGSMETPPAPEPVPEPEPTQQIQENQPASVSTLENQDDDEESGFIRKEAPEEDETVLLNQEFLLDPSLTVRDFLVQNSVEVVDFVRFECGEELPESSSTTS